MSTEPTDEELARIWERAYAETSARAALRLIFEAGRASRDAELTAVKAENERLRAETRDAVATLEHLVADGHHGPWVAIVLAQLTPAESEEP